MAHWDGGKSMAGKPKAISEVMWETWLAKFGPRGVVEQIQAGPNSPQMTCCQAKVGFFEATPPGIWDENKRVSLARLAEISKAAAESSTATHSRLGGVTAIYSYDPKYPGIIGVLLNLIGVPNDAENKEFLLPPVDHFFFSNQYQNGLKTSE
jgi:hypothetical protein